MPSHKRFFSPFLAGRGTQGDGHSTMTDTAPDAAERARRTGLLIVNTGDGKGKTTAALGVMLRAWGRGFKVCAVQFIKSKTANYGEHRAAKKLGIEIIPMGAGFTWLSKDIESDIVLAHNAWELARQRIASGDYDVVVLDEFTYALQYGWVPLEEALSAFKARPAWGPAIVTGRNAPQGLVDAADLVTEMREVKHPYKRGIKAQPGIEF